MWVDMVSFILRKFLMGSHDDTWLPDQLVCSKFSYNTFTSSHRDISVLQSKGRNTKLGSISDLVICLHFFCLKKVLSSLILIFVTSFWRKKDFMEQGLSKLETGLRKQDR